jgi:hypothetical protein
MSLNQPKQVLSDFEHHTYMRSVRVFASELIEECGIGWGGCEMEIGECAGLEAVAGGVDEVMRPLMAEVNLVEDKSK